MTCYRTDLRILWAVRRANVSILREFSINLNKRLLPTIQIHILSFFDHVIRRDGIEKLCIQRQGDGNKNRGWSLVRFIDHIKTNKPIYNRGDASG